MSDIATTVETNEPDTGSSWRPTLPLALVACVVSGAMALGIIQAIHPVFPFEELPEMGQSPSAELMARYHAAEHDFRSSNGALNCGILAGCLGLMLGLLTNSKRWLPALLGGLAGGAVGAVGGYLVGHLVAERLILSGNQVLWESFAFHGGIWALSGAAISLAIAACFARKQPVQAGVSGAVGGLLGAIIYNVVASILYPMSNLILVLPDDVGQRAAWAFSIAIGLGIALALGLRTSPAATSPHATESLVA